MTEPSDAGHAKSYVCKHVFSDDRLVLLVSRPDGDWCFLCGQTDHEQSAADYRVVGMSHVLDRDPSLAEVLDLDVNEEAERKDATGPWVRSRFAPET